MTFYVESEGTKEDRGTGKDKDFPFPLEETAEKVLRAALSYENCPFEAEINLLITDREGIKTYNEEYRGIPKETDVLSFPGVDYEEPGDFSLALSDKNSYFNPETEEILLGDIILCKDRVFSQAEEYGHSVLREFAFLLVHSVLHLLGYDHMEEEDEKIMKKHQDEIMEKLGILR